MARGGDEEIVLKSRSGNSTLFRRSEREGQVFQGPGISKALERSLSDRLLASAPHYLARDRYRISWGKAKSGKGGEEKLEGAIYGGIKTGRIVSRETKYPVTIKGPYLARDGSSYFNLRVKNPYLDPRMTYGQTIFNRNFSNEEEARRFAEEEAIEAIRQNENAAIEAASIAEVAKGKGRDLEKEGLPVSRVRFHVDPSSSSQLSLAEVLAAAEGINDDHPQSEGRLFGYKGGPYAKEKYYEIGDFETTDLANGYKIFNWSVHQEEGGYRAEKLVTGYTWISFNSEHAVIVDRKGRIVKQWEASMRLTDKESRREQRASWVAAAKEYASKS